MKFHAYIHIILITGGSKIEQIDLNRQQKANNKNQFTEPYVYNFESTTSSIVLIFVRCCSTCASTIFDVYGFLYESFVQKFQNLKCIHKAKLNLKEKEIEKLLEDPMKRWNLNRRNQLNRHRASQANEIDEMNTFLPDPHIQRRLTSSSTSSWLF